jgi:hypothetical protein
VLLIENKAIVLRAVSALCGSNSNGNIFEIAVLKALKAILFEAISHIAASLRKTLSSVRR